MKFPTHPKNPERIWLEWLKERERSDAETPVTTAQACACDK
jgi:hypothetical protein